MRLNANIQVSYAIICNYARCYAIFCDCPIACPFLVDRVAWSEVVAFNCIDRDGKMCVVRVRATPSPSQHLCLIRLRLNGILFCEAYRRCCAEIRLRGKRLKPAVLLMNEGIFLKWRCTLLCVVLRINNIKTMPVGEKTGRMGNRHFGVCKTHRRVGNRRPAMDS